MAHLCVLATAQTYLDVQMAPSRQAAERQRQLSANSNATPRWEAGVYWIALRDKPASQEADLSSLLEEAWKNLPTRARNRREKNAAAADFADFPISDAYKAEIARTGATIRTASRWFNAISVRATSAQLHVIQELPFVSFIQPVQMTRLGTPPQSVDEPALPQMGEARTNYGPSSTHLSTINAPAAHALGWTGAGVRIGLLDTGFEHENHEALEPIQIIGEYDFIQEDSVTANQAGDPSGQEDHGTAVLSLVGGYKEGELIGVAYGAEFVLAKTERVDVEVRAEMDLFISGLEYLEAEGCDIVSASLGYLDFPSEPDIAYEELDGWTLPISLACELAWNRGIVMVNAVGNSPWDPPLAPNDAFGMISVGQVKSDGELATASSYGPLIDGRIKPEVCAQGYRAYIADAGTTDSYRLLTSGTSFAAPQVAGVCALILEAHPDWTPDQVRAAILETASQADSPSNGLGWGIVDAVAALAHDGVTAAALWPDAEGDDLFVPQALQVE